MNSRCPICNSPDIEYHPPLETADGKLQYPIDCNSCLFRGIEVYHLTFYCHLDENGKKIKTKKHSGRFLDE
jgi:hypothetical protein